MKKVIRKIQGWTFLSRQNHYTFQSAKYNDFWAICVLLLFCLIYLAGCTSSVLTGDKSNDQGDASSSEANASNIDCRGLDLSHEKLKTKTARQLIHCLNANGSIQAYANLVNKLSDKQLGSYVELFNDQFIDNKKNLKELDRSIDQMGQRGTLDRLLKNSSEVLKQSKLIAAGSRLFRESLGGTNDYTDEQIKAIQILAREFEKRKNGPRENLKELFDLVLRLTSMDAYKLLNRGIKIPGQKFLLPMMTDRALEYVQEKIKCQHGGKHDERALGKLILWGIADGSLLQATDHYLYYQCEGAKNCTEPKKFLTIDEQVQSLEYFLRFTAHEHREDVFKKVTDLYRVMDDPMYCMDGTKKVANVDMYVMSEFLKRDSLEVPQFVLRPNLLKMKLAGNMCEFPEKFDELVGVLKLLANHQERLPGGKTMDRRMLITVANQVKGLAEGEKMPLGPQAEKDLSRYFYKNPTLNSLSKPEFYPDSERYRRMLIHLLGDKNEDINLYTHLSEILSELASPGRDLIGNALYLTGAFAPRTKERALLIEAAQFLVKYRPEIKKSFYDFFSEQLLNLKKGGVVSKSNLTLFVEAFSDLVQSQKGDTDLLSDLLADLRDGLLMNNVNPLVNVTLEVIRNLDRYRGVLTTSLDVAEMPEFEKAIVLTAEMSRNGKLRDFLNGALLFFKKGLDTAAPEPVLANVPPVEPISPELNRSTKNRPQWDPQPPVWPREPDGSESKSMKACLDLNLDISLAPNEMWDDRTQQVWTAQMKALAECVNVAAKYPQVQTLLEYSLQKENYIEGKPLMAFLMNWGKEFFNLPSLTSEQKKFKKDFYSELGGFFVDPAVSPNADPTLFRDLYDFQEILKYTFKKQYPILQRDLATDKPLLLREPIHLAPVQALLRATKFLDRKKEPLQSMMEIGAEWASEKQLGEFVQFTKDVFDDVKADQTPITESLRPPLYKRNEYGFPTNKDLAADVRAKLIRYEKPDLSSIEGLMLDREVGYWTRLQSGVDRRYYTNSEEFKKTVRPLLDWIAKPATPGLPSILESTLLFFSKTDSNPYDIKWFDAWFKRLSSNLKAMPYYFEGRYPGRHKPEVIIVSQLDLLELIVIDADFTLKAIGQGYGSLMGKDENENFAIRYLSLLALAKEHPKGMIQGLKEWIEMMRSDLHEFHCIAFGEDERDACSIALQLQYQIGGGIMQPELKRRLFNLYHIFPIVQELVATNDLLAAPTGERKERNDLGILGDLFYSVLASTPRTMWNVYEKDKNSLGVIAELVRFGLTRNIGSNIWYLDPTAEKEVPKTKEEEEAAAAKAPLSHQVKYVSIEPALGFIAQAAYRKNEKGKYEVNPDTFIGLDYVLRKNRNQCAGQHASFNNCYEVIGKLIDVIFEWVKDDDERRFKGQARVLTMLKQTLYEGSLFLDYLEKYLIAHGKKQQFYTAVSKATRPMIGTYEGTTALISLVNHLEPIVKEAKSIRVLQRVMSSRNVTDPKPHRTFAEAKMFERLVELSIKSIDMLAEQNAKRAEHGVVLLSAALNDPEKRLDQLLDTLKSMSENRDFQNFQQQHLDRIMDRVWDWWLKTSSSQQGSAALERAQVFAVESMRSGKLTELALFLAREAQKDNPDVLYDKLKFLGEDDYIRDIRKSMEFMRSGIQDAF